MTTADRDTLAILVHGEPGMGKSWLGQTAPAPRLILDAEGGSRAPKRIDPETGRAVRIKQVTWDPAMPLPEADGTWESCRVVVRDFGTVERVFEVLDSGVHPFQSVVIDSLTELQKRCKDSIRTGDEVMNERMWGILLDRMELKLRQFRDLVFHPIKPIQALVLLALTQEKSMKFKPAVQGALAVSLPGYLDTIGYMAVTVLEDGTEERRLLIQPHDRYEAKDRTHTLHEHYGRVIVNPDISKMLDVLNEES